MPVFKKSCLGCLVGGVIGHGLMFLVFVAFLRFSAQPPFTEIDLIFDLIVATFIGGFLGAVIYPLYRKNK